MSKASGLLGAWLAVLAAGAPAAGEPAAGAPAAGEPALGTPALETIERPVSEALLAYDAAEGQVLLPLGETAAALGLAIDVDPGSGVAQGWILAENRAFVLDVGRREAWVEGRPAEWDDELVELHAMDIFVAASLLERWLPVELDVDLLNSRVRVRSREALPVEEQLERQRRWQRLGAPSPGLVHRFPLQPLPYRAIDWPVLDHRLVLSFEDDPRRGLGQRLQSDLVATGDLLFLNAELALGWSDGDGQSVPNVRLRLGRRDPGGGLLGSGGARLVDRDRPVGVTEFGVGDLLTRQRPLVSVESYARGFELSTFPVDRPERFDRTTLRGDALAGWEVELYHNDELIAFQRVDDSNHYAFLDVPLFVGLNVLRLVFYGPQGERREKVERVLVGEALIRQGESHYRVAVHQQGRRLFVDEPLGPSPTAPAVPAATSDPAAGLDTGRGAPRLFLEWERGLRSDLSLSAGFQSLTLGGERHDYASLGLLGSRKGVLGQLHLVADRAGGWAGRVAAEGQLAVARFRFEHEELRAFVSEQIEPSDPLLRRSAVELEARTAGPWQGPLRISFSAAADHRRSGAAQTVLRTRLSTSPRPRLSLAQSVELRERLGGPASGSELTSSWLVAGRFGARTRLRGGLTARLDPGTELAELNLTLDRRWSAAFSSRFQARHGLAERQPDAFSGSLDWRLRPLALGLTVGWQEPGRLRVGFALSYSLMRHPLAGRFRPSSRPLATQGAVAARVYLDQNLNDRFDRGDEPLPGVRLEVDGGGRPEPTDGRGLTVLAQLEPHRRLDVGLDVASLGDPYWVPRRRGAGFVARPGRLAVIDFPVVTSGEIDGTVYLRQEGREVPVSKVELELVDAAGEVVAAARSAYDGFYLFEQVPPGRYLLRLAEAQLQRLGLVSGPSRRIEIGFDGTVVSGMDFVLERQG